MKRNLLSNGSHAADHQSDNILKYLQQTIAAQDKKLSCMADDINLFKNTDHLGSNTAQTISQLGWFLN